MLLFEDSKTSGISKLLTTAFIKVDFSDGNELLKYKIDEWLEKGERVICYVDYPIDSEEIVSLVEDLIIMYEGNNVVFIKIPCIEFIVLNMLIGLNILKNSDYLVRFKKSLMGDKIEYKESHYEKFCKSVLNGSTKRCVHNEQLNSKITSWYAGACDCTENYSIKCSRLSMNQKVAALAYFMPYYEYLGRVPSLVLSGKLYRRSIDEAIEYTDKWINTISKAIL